MNNIVTILFRLPNLLPCSTTIQALFIIIVLVSGCADADSEDATRGDASIAAPTHAAFCQARAEITCATFAECCGIDESSCIDTTVENCVSEREIFTQEDRQFDQHTAEECLVRLHDVTEGCSYISADSEEYYSSYRICMRVFLREDAGIPAKEDESCEASRHCAPGFYCDRAIDPPRCARLHLVGEPCSDGDQCTSRVCQQDRCVQISFDMVCETMVERSDDTK